MGECWIGVSWKRSRAAFGANLRFFRFRIDFDEKFFGGDINRFERFSSFGEMR